LEREVTFDLFTRDIKLVIRKSFYTFFEGDFCSAPSYSISIQYDDKFLRAETERQGLCSSTSCFPSQSIILILGESERRVLKIKINPRGTKSLSCLASNKVL